MTSTSIIAHAIENERLLRVVNYRGEWNGQNLTGALMVVGRKLNDNHPDNYPAWYNEYSKNYEIEHKRTWNQAQGRFEVVYMVKTDQSHDTIARPGDYILALPSITHQVVLDLVVIPDRFMRALLLEPPMEFADNFAKIREVGLLDPWRPRDHYSSMVDRKALKEDLSKLMHLAQGAFEEASGYTFNTDEIVKEVSDYFLDTTGEVFIFHPEALDFEMQEDGVLKITFKDQGAASLLAFKDKPDHYLVQLKKSGEQNETA